MGRGSVRTPSSPRQRCLAKRLDFEDFEKPVKVAPLLVLPGWFIDRRCKLPVTVLSGREVTAQVPKLDGAPLNADEIRRIAAMIEDRNRSVEY